jgi:hypothetical protein
MQKIIFTLILISLSIFCFAQGNYYDSVIDLTGQTLYTALHSLILPIPIITIMVLKLFFSSNWIMLMAM